MTKILTVILLLVFCEVEDSSLQQTFAYSSKPKFTRESLEHYIIEVGILHPEIVLAQSVLETGGYTSRIFRENHNLFGMKLAKKRPTLATGERYGHATYDSWTDSVEDYLLWQQMWQVTPIATEYHYFLLLDKLYAEDPDYIKTVKIVRKRNELI